MAENPAKLAQKDRDARWTVKWSKAKPAEDGSPRINLAVPAFGYKNHIGIDRRHGLIRTWSATDAASYDGAQLPILISKENTASDVWADTAYRSKANEKHLADHGLRSRIHRKKPKGKPMPANTARANGAKSKVRAAVEHVFAHETRTDGARRAHDRSGPRPREDRAGQPRLHHEACRLAHRANGGGVTKTREAPHPRTTNPNSRPRRLLLTASQPPTIDLTQIPPPQNMVLGGVQTSHPFRDLVLTVRRALLA